MRLVEKSGNNVEQKCLNNVYALFHNAKKHWVLILKCVEKYFILLDWYIKKGVLQIQHTFSTLIWCTRLVNMSNKLQ